MDLTVVAYVIYLLITVALTVWVARTLSRNGRIFLADVLHGNEKLAEAVNHLLVVGFYLVNLGFVTLYLKNADGVANAREPLRGPLGEGGRGAAGARCHAPGQRLGPQPHPPPQRPGARADPARAAAGLDAPGHPGAVGRARTGTMSPVTEAAPAAAPGPAPYAAGGSAPVRRLHRALRRAVPTLRPPAELAPAAASARPAGSRTGRIGRGAAAVP